MTHESAPTETFVAHRAEGELAHRLRAQYERFGWALFALPAAIYIGLLFFFGFFELFRESIDYPADPSVETYRSLVASEAFRRALLRTVRLSVVVTVATTVISYPIAYFVARVPAHRRNAWLLVVLLPWLTSVVVRSFSWRILLGDRGAINSALQAIGVIDEPLQLINNELGMAIGLIHVLCPFMILSLLAVFMSLDVRLEEAAAMLGASPFRTFTRIILPLTRTGMATGGILVFLLAAASYVTPQMLGGIRERTLSMLMYSQLLELFDFRRGAALAFVLVALVVPVALALQWYERRGGR